MHLFTFCFLLLVYLFLKERAREGKEQKGRGQRDGRAILRSGSDIAYSAVSVNKSCASPSNLQRTLCTHGDLGAWCVGYVCCVWYGLLCVLCVCDRCVCGVCVGYDMWYV